MLFGRKVEISFRRRGSIYAGLYKFADPDNWSIGLGFWWLTVFVKLPFRVNRPVKDGELLDKWGFDLNPDTLGFDWGPGRSRLYWHPWRHERRQDWMLGAHGLWIRRDYDFQKGFVPWYDDPLLWTEEYDYTYKLKGDGVQKRIAKIGLLRNETTCRILCKTSLRWPWPLRKVADYIEVSFSEEIGERAGSWKGGCIGCSYRVLPGESPYETLKRMERDRKF